MLPAQNKQKKGPYCNPLYGFVPIAKYHTVIVEAGMFLCYGGYLACSMIALSAALTAFDSYYVPLVMGCEFAAVCAVLASRDQLIFILEQPGSNVISPCFNFCLYVLMSVMPFVPLHSDGFIGGGWYSSIIIYRVISCAIVVIFATNNFGSSDATAEAVHIRGETVITMFFIALFATIIGATLFLRFIMRSRRSNFYRSRRTPAMFYDWLFDAHQLLYDSNTKDQQRTYIWLETHPKYFAKDKVKAWLLGLKSDGDILGGGDKNLPKGCNQFSGHLIDSFFTKSLQRFAWYNDAEGFAQVKAHLDELKEEVDKRPLSIVTRATLKEHGTTTNTSDDNKEREKHLTPNTSDDNNKEREEHLVEESQQIKTLKQEISRLEAVVAAIGATIPS